MNRGRPTKLDKRRCVGTKIDPDLIDYIDDVAEIMGLTRYKLLQRVLTEVFVEQKRPQY